jgi:putative holliday junction resolvase
MKRIVGLDVGDKTIGVAVSDELRLTAQGVTVRRRSSFADDMAFVRELCPRMAPRLSWLGCPGTWMARWAYRRRKR